jgi:hypothetical protein
VADRRSARDPDDGPEQVDDPALIAAARHALHDEELVAAYAVEGDAADDAAKARSLIERCATCRALHADVVAIGSSIRAVGTAPAVGAARSAPRDFRLTPMDAARLQGGNAFGRAAARVLAGAAMFGRPIGAGLGALGVVGLIVASIGLGQLSVAEAPQDERAGAAAGATTQPPAAAATGQPAATSSFDRLSSQPGASRNDQSYGGPVASAAASAVPSAATPGGPSAATDGATTGGGVLQLVVAGSVLLLVIGLALFLRGLRHARAWNRPSQPT